MPVDISLGHILIIGEYNRNESLVQAGQFAIAYATSPGAPSGQELKGISAETFYFSNNLDISGTMFSNSLDVSNNTILKGTLDVCSNTFIHNNLNIHGDTEIIGFLRLPQGIYFENGIPNIPLSYKNNWRTAIGLDNNNSGRTLLGLGIQITLLLII